LLLLSLREWLPEGHLAWFVIDAVAELDLSAFYGLTAPMRGTTSKWTSSRGAASRC
jgi:hypothetical protein